MGWDPAESADSRRGSSSRCAAALPGRTVSAGTRGSTAGDGNHPAAPWLDPSPSLQLNTDTNYSFTKNCKMHKNNSAITTIHLGIAVRSLCSTGDNSYHNVPSLRTKHTENASRPAGRCAFPDGSNENRPRRGNAAPQRRCGSGPQARTAGKGAGTAAGTTPGRRSAGRRYRRRLDARAARR